MKRIIKLSSISILLLLLEASNLYAQNISQGSISGKVYDVETNMPLFYANVFLANTTLGCASDKNGRFQIKNIPLGNYQLVVSMIGYEIKKINITVRYSKNQNISISLKCKTLQGQTITVSAYKPGSWQKNFQTFKKLLLGRSLFADQCRLLNTNVLNLKYNKITHTLSALTKAPLHIENRALGYDIYLTIEEFSYQGVGFLKFKGIPRFVEKKPLNKIQRRLWIENRMKAYNGSFRHFLACLANGTLKEQGFKIFLVNRITLHQNFTKINEPAQEVNSDSITFAAQSIFERKLFFKKYLKIEYLREPESERYMPYSKKKAFQTSWISINSNQPVIFTVYGSLYDQFQIKTYGYWAWERFAEALPYNYVPDPVSMIQFLKPITFSLNKIETFDKVSKIHDTRSTISSLDIFKKSINAVLSGKKKLGTFLFYKGLLSPNSPSIFDSLYIPSSYLVQNQNSKNRWNCNNINLMRMWIKLDPTPATLTNEAYCELVNRISSLSKISGKYQIKDDKKMVYLKFGKPDRFIDINKSELVPENSCWVYKRDTTEIIFDFLKSDSSYILLKDPNTLISRNNVNYVEKLMEYIQSRSMISKLYYNFIVSISRNINNSKKHAVTEKNIYKFLSDKLLNHFSDFYNLIIDRQNNLSFFPLMNPSQTINDVLFNLYIIPTDSNKQSINLYIGIPCSQLGILQNGPSPISYLKIYYTIFNKNNDVLCRKEFNGTIKYSNQSIPVNSLAISSISETLPHDQYKIVFLVKDSLTNKSWFGERVFTIPANSKNLFLSDIMPVYQAPNKNYSAYPFTKLSKSLNFGFMVWFKNLKKNINGLYKFKLSWDLKRNNISIFRKSYALRKEIIEERKNSNGHKILNVNLSQAVPGSYDLIISLKDLNNNNEQKSKLRIYIFD